MNKTLSSLVAVAMGASLTIATIGSASACTRAFLNTYPGYMVSARNLDFFGPVDPSLVITPKGIKHTGSDGPGAKQWETRYGSVVIYADGVFPMDGMNEKGLAGHTQYYTNGKQVQAGNQDKPELDSRAWLSYLLDNFATVDEAVKGLQDVRLVAKKLPIDYASDTKHIALEDVTGDSAIIEIDNGKVNIYHNPDYRVMTNPPSYDRQLENLKKYQGIDENHIPGTQSAEDRFVRTSIGVKNIPQPDNKAQAQGFILSVVNNAAFPINYPDASDPMVKSITDAYAKYSKFPQENKGTSTYWTTIADLSHGEYHFKSVFAPSEVMVKLQEINFSAGQPVKRIDHLQNYAQKGWQGDVLKYATGS
ncbi:linear amide C-N hydrolase [Erwinia sp. SLM-02]|uniref:linear amide C-N hydrolase n=1 Tax=Erwinia sp. SLM-02 TaxID=3020057 RepID=UPI00308001CA